MLCRNKEYGTMFGSADLACIVNLVLCNYGCYDRSCTFGVVVVFALVVPSFDYRYTSSVSGELFSPLASVILSALVNIYGLALFHFVQSYFHTLPLLQCFFKFTALVLLISKTQNCFALLFQFNTSLSH